MKEKTVNVVQDEADPVATEVMAKAIIEIDKGIKHLLAGGLSRRAIAVLVRDKTGVPMTEIHKVMDALNTLRRDYCTK